jgi:uncharacterized protein GlcG (DUF336 family)
VPAQRLHVEVTIYIILDASGNLLLLQKADSAAVNLISWARKKVWHAACCMMPTKDGAEALKAEAEG